MLIRCACGKMTNFGLLCVNCSKEQEVSQEEISLDDIDVEELIEDSDTPS